MARRTSKRGEKPFFGNGPKPEMVVAPSVLSADFAELGKELARCRRSNARWIHIDVMDGHFVPNLTIGPPLVKAWRKAQPELFFDTHLMVEKPMRLAEMFQEAGSSMITIHVEATHNAARDVRALKRSGLRVGISIKPGTPVRAIKDCLALVDLVLVMTVEPGEGGQQLIPKTLNKVRELDLIRRERDLDFRLQVDGGINKRTAPLAVAAGADVLVAGTAVFGGSGTVAENLKALREAISKTSITPPPRRSGRRKKRP